MVNIVGVRFKPVGKIYFFTPPENTRLEMGDGVIVETARGIEYGYVVQPPCDVDDNEVVHPLKPVLRKATEKDEKQLEENEQKKFEAIKIAKEKIEKHKLDMKLVDAEYTFDTSKLIFYFVSEGRVDFRELVRDLASVFKKRIELRQIGIRDQSKMVGGLAPCGKICCCAQHLPEFKHVSIKMAKMQLLSLNPSKISGLCGRLMCCLEYENDYYCDAAKKMPKVGSEVITPDGKGTVLSNNFLNLKCTVRVEGRDGSAESKEYNLKNIKAKQTMAEDAEDDNSINDEEIKKLLD